MESGEILIVVLCHRPGKKVTMISTSDDLKFVKTGINNEKKERLARLGTTTVHIPISDEGHRCLLRSHRYTAA